MAEDETQAVQHLPSKHETLNSTPVPPQIKTKQTEHVRRRVTFFRERKKFHVGSMKLFLWRYK
jgi:hypothetical protein